MRSITGCLVVALLAAVPALAIDTPHVAGDFQGWDAGADPMVETAPDSGIYLATFTGMDPGSRHLFKITDGTWDNAVPDSDSWFYADGNGDITIQYDSNTYDDGWAPSWDRIVVFPDVVDWTAVGSYQGWDPNDPGSAMADAGGGLYMKEVTGLMSACYLWKAVNTDSWDSVSWDGRSVNTANMEFCPSAPEDVVKLWLDTSNGTVKVEIDYDCFGDLNGDKIIELADLATLLANFGVTEGMHYIDGDLDGDGDVDLSDLAALLAVYGDVCL